MVTKYRISNPAQSRTISLSDRLSLGQSLFLKISLSDNLSLSLNHSPGQSLTQTIILPDNMLQNVRRKVLPSGTCFKISYVEISCRVANGY